MHQLGLQGLYSLIAPTTGVFPGTGFGTGIFRSHAPVVPVVAPGLVQAQCIICSVWTRQGHRTTDHLQHHLVVYKLLHTTAPWWIAVQHIRWWQIRSTSAATCNGCNSIVLQYHLLVYTNCHRLGLVVATNKARVQFSTRRTGAVQGGTKASYLNKNVL